jgi:T3SS (YopN, CesT) and YbjN peptide-binding chaperone 1
MVDMEQDFVLMFPDGVSVFVMPRDLPDGHTVVRVESLCVKDMRIDGDLGIFIAEENARRLFGKLALYTDRREVHFEESLLGDFLNQAELEIAVGMVAVCSNEYDDRIKEKWGGKKWSEL